MKKSKYVAMLLVVVMSISLLPPQIFANEQNPVQKIIDIVVNHTENLNNDTIIPKVNMTWQRPVTNDAGENATSYIISVKDNSGLNPGVTSKTVKAENNPQMTYEMGTQATGLPLKSGVFYQTTLQGQHTHTIDGVTSTHTSPITPQGTGYFITDFDTKLKGVKDKIELTWEYIPGIDYEVTYAQGDYGRIEEFPKDGVTKYILKSDEAEKLKYKDENTGRTGVKYIIDTNIVPGQVYSAYVVPKIPAKHPLSSETIYMGSAPKVAVGVTEIGLKVFNVGNEMIRLEWNIEPSIMAGKYELVESKIWAQPIDGQPYTVYTFKGTNGKLGYYEMYEPKKETYFWIEFKFQNKDSTNSEILVPMPMTEKVLYIPYDMIEKPLPPRIPKPASKSTDFTEENVKDYTVSEDDVSKEMLDEDSKILKRTFHVSSLNPLKVQLVWDAPTTKNEEGTKVVDYNLEYDIWVADNKKALDNIEPTKRIPVSFFKDKAENQIKNQKNDVIGFSSEINEYYNGNSERKAIVPNKMYYIKIVAKKPYGENYIKSDPTTVAITLGKDGDIFAPPVLGKPPLKLKKNGVTTTTATINWLETWYEIIAQNPSKEMYPDEVELSLAQMWNARVFTGNSNPAIHFKQNEVKKLEEHILTTKNKLGIVEAIVKEKTGDKDHFINNYISRQVTLGKDVKYEIKLVPYTEIQNKLGGEDISIWIQENESDSTEGWQTISPTEIEEIDEDNEKLIWKEHTIQGLKANTSYVAMVRAYRELPDGEILPQTYPSYLIFTTLSDHDSPEEIPTVPVLNLDGKSDTSISVWWKYNSQFDYEIVYSRTDDPNKAKKWDFKFSDNPEDPNYLEDGGKASVSINGLFPDTTYNIWIRAKQKKGTEVSAWSNPVTAKTDSIKAPAPPTGLGPAAYQSILELGLDFKPVASDYITVEWTKNPNDVGTQVEGTIEKSYEYDLEFADNVEFLDSKIVTISDGNIGSTNKGYEILDKNMVKFTGLIANRPYYVKVKTRIVLKDTEEKKEIKKESDYTKWVRIITKTSDDEYDGGDNDNIVIYPENITEDYKNGVWTIEIVNAQGIITEILNKKDYYLTIDAQLYNRRYDADIRKIRVPKSVLNALAGQGMELKVITNMGKYEIKPQTLAYYTQKAGANDIVEFEFKTVLAYDAREIAKPYPYVMLTGESLSIFTKGNNAPMTKLDGYMKVSTKLPVETDLLYRSLDAYIYANQSGTWVKQAKNIEQYNEANYLSYTTPLLGLYATYRVESYADENNMSYAMQTIANQYGVSELGNSYMAYSKVHSNQYIQLLLGIAKNSPSITLNGQASVEAKKQAKSSGIYIENNSGYITEEQAISGIVKLYEMKLGYKVKPSSRSFTGVSRSYSENVSKAYGLGIIETINPQKGVSYSTLCEWMINAGF